MNTMPDDAEPVEPSLSGMLYDPGPVQSAAVQAAPPSESPRLRRPERAQGEMRIASLDELLPPDHVARLVWEFVSKVDIRPLLEPIKALPGQAGRDATDPRLLLALWLYATIDGVGSARTLDVLCREHMAYQWLCGGVTLNYHTLADFRSRQTAFLDGLLTDSVATLLHEGLVELKRVAQDGMRVRASAGASSFRREKSLQACLAEADAQVQALKNHVDEDTQAATRRQQAARERAARERQQRLQQALAARQQLLATREQQKKEKGVKFDAQELRASTTDAEARKMKMPDGGTRPGYNVQFASTTDNGIVVGVDVTNSGSDNGQMQPMLEQIQRRYDQQPEQVLVDGGFTTLNDIEQAEGNHVEVIGPIKNEDSKKTKGQDPYQPRKKDGPGVAAWRQRMGTPEAKAIYRLRAQTAEWVNAGARNRGLYQVTVRGRQKVLAVALLHALVHNLLRAQSLRQDQERKK
jgi:transposase